MVWHGHACTKSLHASNYTHINTGLRMFRLYSSGHPQEGKEKLLSGLGHGTPAQDHAISKTTALEQQQRHLPLVTSSQLQRTACIAVTSGTPVRHLTWA